MEEAGSSGCVVLRCSRGTCRRILGALTYQRDGPLRQTGCLHCFLNIASPKVVWRKFHSLIFEILEDIQNDTFGDCVVHHFWCCHHETQTRNEARNCIFMVVLGANVHAFHENRGCIYIKITLFVIQQFVCFISLITKTKKYVLPLGFEFGIA